MSATRESRVARAFRLPEILGAVLLGIGYYLAVHAGIALTLPSSAVSIVWPANAILLAALLLAPPGRWWLLITAVLPAHFAAEIELGVPFTMAALWFLTNVAEALIGATITLRYVGTTPRFDRVRDLSIFLVAGVLIAPLLSSFVDVAFVALVDWRYDDFWQTWRTRVFSNALAALTLVPLIVIWWRGGIKSLWQSTFTGTYEAAALLMGICAVSAVVFQRSYGPGEFAMFLYVPLPFLLWAAVRHGVAGVNFCAAVMAFFAITGVLVGRGPAAAGGPESAALTVQTFLIISESSLMLLAASLAELRGSRRDLARQRERLSLALHAAEMGTWDWDIAQDVVTWRSAQGPEGSYAPPRGGSRARLLSLVHEADRRRVVRALDRAMKERGSGEVECRFRDGHGNYRWITGRGRILSDDKGKARRMIGVFIDTTDRKQREMQNQAQLTQLTYLSRVSILGELAGAIAHELNQPLTAILLNAQAGLRGMKDSPENLTEINEILQDIVSSDQHAGEVIRRLRALFLRGAIEQQPVDVNQCIEQVLRLEHPDLVVHQVVTDLQLDPDLPPVLGDQVQLQQVLLNLIVNARDAMVENGPHDRTLGITSSFSDGLVQVEIRDSGHGIQDIERIFDPFVSTKRHGIGIGLSICRTIIAAHGGRLLASNNANRGATFCLSIPAASPRSGATT
jgi:signal transduction histidine kinase